MKKLLILFLMLFTTVAQANITDDCLTKIAANDELWQQRLFDKQDGIFNQINDTDDITDEIVQSKKTQIYALLASNILLNCRDDLSTIFKSERGIIKFTHNNKNYAFNFDIETLAEYIEIRTGILVINNKTLTPGAVLQLSDIPKKQKFFSDECSDWTVWDNLDDDAAVNIAGQAVFNDFGGSKNEFFLDFAEGDNRRAFPGLVLMDKTGSTQETIVSYRNMRTGINKAKAFADKLKGGVCSNQGLSVYLVGLDVTRDTSSERRGWLIAATVAGTAGIWIGASTAAVALGAAATGIGAALWGTAAALTAIPGPGWVGAVVVGAAAAIVTTVGLVASLFPAEIEDIQQVMILDGPYNL